MHKDQLPCQPRNWSLCFAQLRISGKLKRQNRLPHFTMNRCISQLLLPWTTGCSQRFKSDLNFQWYQHTQSGAWVWLYEQEREREREREHEWKRERVRYWLFRLDFVMLSMDFRMAANCCVISFCNFKCNCVNFRSNFTSKIFRSPYPKFFEVEDCIICVICGFFTVISTIASAL